MFPSLLCESNFPGSPVVLNTVIEFLRTFGKVKWKTRSAECGVWKMRSVGKCGVWKMRSVENAECGKCGV